MWTWLFTAPWIVFGAWWLVRAVGTARTVERESARQLLSHRVFFAAGTLFLAYPPAEMRARLWPGSLALVVVALALEVAGVAFAIWAREHLGRLWSGTVTLKEGHRIVQTGPYRLARHPIYTGLVVGLAGTVLGRGNLGALIGYALFVAGIARKIAVEEKMLGERFGDEYAEYRRKVRAVIPFVL
ncbi:MAG TPA: isoprenylcysteine carboxylmethyltransferase family protein [Polyangia bacterium]